MKNMKWAFILAMAALIAGCELAPQAINMVPYVDTKTHSTMNKTIRISLVLGGTESDLVAAKIDNASFTIALTQTLINSKLFSTVNPQANPDFDLSATIVMQNQPSVALDTTVSLLVRYELSNAADGSQVWQKDILSQHTVQLGEDLIGASRMVKANEGAARENLKSLIEELSKLKL